MRALLARLARSHAAAATAEFALVAPTFLMFLFLIMDGGRMVFTKQALNELAAAAARCAAIKETGCTTTTATQTWTVNRGQTRSALALTMSEVTVDTAATCNGQSGMAKATIALPYPKGVLSLLPQTPSTLTAVACFPVAA